MMGDKDYKQTINSALDTLTKETTHQISNSGDKNEVFLHEVSRCMRRSYFDRFDAIETPGRDFDRVLGGLIRKLPYGSKLGEFAIDEIKLKGQADMIVDDIVVIFKTIKESPENPDASDVLYLNGCMWIFNKTEGIIVYMTGDGVETSFALYREKKMFEEVIRRVRVFSNLIADKKTPILEPSSECTRCQYYEKCYIKKREGKQITISELFGSKNK
jgi:CRISPR-associated exonuclease Cas4